MDSDSEKGPRRLFGFINEYRYHVCLFLLVILVACIRMSLIDLPLERDEGEYAYAGQLILEGSLPYAEVYNMKLPGVYFAYAGMEALFGHTHQAVRIGLACVNILTMVLLFSLGKNLIDPLAGLIASAVYAVLTLDPVLQGMFANSEHFVNLFAAGGMVLLLHALKKNRPAIYFISGLLFGAGVIMKQHGAFFSLFALSYLIAAALMAGSTFLHVIRRGLLFSAGAAVPYGCVCLLFWSAGIFDKFWFWTVQYASMYTAQVPLALGWEMLKETLRDIFKSSPLVWLLAGISLMSPVWSRQARKHVFFTHGLLFFSLLSVMPGLYFRRHYFLLLAPAVSLLLGMAVSTARDEVSAKAGGRGFPAFLPILILLAVLAGSLYKHGSFLLGEAPDQLSRSIYGLNPFPESLEIGRFIRENSGRNDRVAVVGSEPQIYFYSGRRSATGYIYMYPLMELHEFALAMQKAMIGEIEEKNPEFLVFVHVDASWGVQTGSNDMLLNWLNGYQSRHYRPAGIIDITKYGTNYYWAPNLKWPPDSKQWIVVFRRIGDHSPLGGTPQ